jgi:hypothetical protein
MILYLDNKGTFFGFLEKKALLNKGNLGSFVTQE